MYIKALEVELEASSVVCSPCLSSFSFSLLESLSSVSSFFLNHRVGLGLSVFVWLSLRTDVM